MQEYNRFIIQIILVADIEMYSRYLLKTSHFGCISDILFQFSLRKCHCISKIHLEILRSEDLESTLLKNGG